MSLCDVLDKLHCWEETRRTQKVNKWEKHILSFPPKVEMLSAVNNSGLKPVDMQSVEARQVGKMPSQNKKKLNKKFTEEQVREREKYK